MPARQPENSSVRRCERGRRVRLRRDGRLAAALPHRRHGSHPRRAGRTGVAAGPSLATIPYRSLLCDQVATLPEPVGVDDWAGFARDVSAVRPIAKSHLAAVTAAEDTGASTGTDLRDALSARTLGEQTMRSGLEWANGAEVTCIVPRRPTARQRGILASEIAIALATGDHANTAWLKGVVATRGSPKRGEVGEMAKRFAWLLVQHADADPAFRVRALCAMEPLVEASEADRWRYARLYDRIMLKLTGMQRYGTQLTC